MKKNERKVILKSLADINNNAFFAFYSAIEDYKRDCLIEIVKSVADLLEFLK